MLQIFSQLEKISAFQTQNSASEKWFDTDRKHLRKTLRSLSNLKHRKPATLNSTSSTGKRWNSTEEHLEVKEGSMRNINSMQLLYCLKLFLGKKGYSFNNGGNGEISKHFENLYSTTPNLAQIDLFNKWQISESVVEEGNQNSLEYQITQKDQLSKIQILTTQESQWSRWNLK